MFFCNSQKSKPTTTATAIVQCGRLVSQPSIIDMFHSMSKSKASRPHYMYIPPIPCTCWKYMWTDDYNVLAYRKRQAKNHAILGIIQYCSCTLYLVYQGLFQYCLLLGLFQKLSLGGWAAGTFLSYGGEGVLLTMCPRGGGSLWSSGPGGGGLTCPGGRGVFDP